MQSETGSLTIVETVGGDMVKKYSCITCLPLMKLGYLGASKMEVTEFEVA